MTNDQFERAKTVQKQIQILDQFVNLLNMVENGSVINIGGNKLQGAKPTLTISFPILCEDDVKTAKDLKDKIFEIRQNLQDTFNKL